MFNVLIDLDGTLTDTNSNIFNEIKYGERRNFSTSEIPVYNGASEFISELRKISKSVTIISDSHEYYVGKISNELFNVEYLSLAQKPNTIKTKNFIIDKFNFEEGYSEKYFIFIGDRDLDIKLARGLSLQSILLHQGNEYKPSLFKMGSTYVSKKYTDILDIIKNPSRNRLVLEDKEGTKSAILLNEKNKNGGYTMFRGLARQNKGLCDVYGAQERYHLFQSSKRTQSFLSKISEDVSNYLNNIILSFSNKFQWDIITYIPDKTTTIPKHKMKDFINNLSTSIHKIDLMEWSDSTTGRIREINSSHGRIKFINESINLKSFDIKDKSIIVFDDQYTTGSTSISISNKLIDRGAKNILFISLFYIIDEVHPEINCPKCGKRCSIKYNTKEGNYFYSCVPPKYRGSGCGWTKNII